MKLTVKTARDILLACTTLTSGTHSVLTKLANGDSASAQVAYKLDDKARWNLTKNQQLAETIVKRADKQIEGIVREIESRNEGKPVTKRERPDLYAEWEKRREDTENTVESAPMLKVKLSGLKISDDNPVPGVVVTALWPVLDFDVPAPSADDVIPDAEPSTT